VKDLLRLSKGDYPRARTNENVKERKRSVSGGKLTKNSGYRGLLKIAFKKKGQKTPTTPKKNGRKGKKKDVERPLQPFAKRRTV